MSVGKCQENVFNLSPNAFDDQYIGCEKEMETEMARELEKELQNNQFKESWKKANDEWKLKKSAFPSLNDNYGTAVVLYTMEKPHYIYKQLNGNISIAGKSWKDYMNNFHFKAFHFYLTRALQVMRTGCTKSQVYRGIDLKTQTPVKVKSPMRFGQFASSSEIKSEAEKFGKDPFFNIITCYGVNIAGLSFFPNEREVLIPIGEKFKMKKKDGSIYDLESTGQLCSYFNCAYLKSKDLRYGQHIVTGWYP
ncbi:ecto-ADP-ribosyltransferase 5-like [Pyxicephalus adspersus]